MSGPIRHAVAAAAILTLAVGGTSRSSPPAFPPTVPTFPAAAQPGGESIPATLPYPAKAPVVVQINGVEQARERLTKMLTAALPKEAAVITKELDAGLKQALAGRKLTAIPKAGRAFLVVHDIAKLIEDEPPISVLVPVTSYKDFQATFLTADERKTLEKGKDKVDSVRAAVGGDEHTVYMVDLKDYVAFTGDRATAEGYAGNYERAKSGTMGAELAGSFLRSDLSVFVNVDEINALYGEQIRQFKGLIDFALMQAQMGGMVPGLDKQQIEAAKLVLGGMFQGVEDCQGVVLAAEFRPEGLNLRIQGKFADGTPSAKMLAAENPTPLADLAKMPKGLHTYSASKLGKKVTDAMASFGSGFLAPEDDEKAAREIKKAFEDLAASGGGADFGASSTPDAALEVHAYKDADRAAAATLRAFKALPAGGKYATVVLKGKPTVKEAAKTHRGLTFAEVSMSFDLEATVKDFPDNLKESMLGQLKRVIKERMTFWVGSDGKSVFTLNAKDWEAATKLLDDYLDGKNGVGTEAGFKATRSNLPADASMIAMSETTGFIEMAVMQLKSVADNLPGGAFPPIGNVKKIKAEATYLGMAVTLKPGLATVDVFVPTGAMGVAAKMLAPVFRPIE